MKQDRTLRELQTNLPWSIHYSADFRANPQPHKDFAHGLTHVHKAAGMLSALVDDMDHRKETADQSTLRDDYGKYLTDLVIYAMRMANTFPGGVFDLQRAVENRLESKNGVELPRLTEDASACSYEPAKLTHVEEYTEWLRFLDELKSMRKNRSMSMTGRVIK